MVKIAKDPTNPIEYQIQKDIFDWTVEPQQLNLYPELKWLNGSLNGVRLTIGAALKAKRGGMKKGFPDLSLPVKTKLYNGLFIELKRKGGKASPEQLEWLEHLKSQGYKAVVCVGFAAAIKTITDYLNGEVED